MTNRKIRVPVFLSEQEIDAVSEYRWLNRVSSQTEAVRQLITKGLEVQNKKADAASTASA